VSLGQITNVLTKSHSHTISKYDGKIAVGRQNNYFMAINTMRSAQPP